MPLPRQLARFNRAVTNRLTGVIAGWMPGFAVIEHAGRRSGRRYRTPVNAFRRGDTLTIALTYGQDSEWLKNVLAAGGCDARSGGNTFVLEAPRLIHDERRRAVPAAVRLVLHAIDVADFLELTIASPSGAHTQG